MSDVERIKALNKVYCRTRTNDGRVCILYKNHQGPHAENHLKSYWEHDPRCMSFKHYEGFEFPLSCDCETLRLLDKYDKENQIS